MPNDVKVQIRMPQRLKAAIDEVAAKEYTSFSTVARRTLARVFLANAVTVEQCSTLTDTREVYETDGEEVE